nr:unnamed protein product [Digitaria exilis]
MLPRSPSPLSVAFEPPWLEAERSYYGVGEGRQRQGGVVRRGHWVATRTKCDNLFFLFSMQAADQCPDDSTLYSNRCLCWLKMGKGDQALSDSGICRIQRPGWAKACYLQGAALMLLKDYEKACDAFVDGLKLDPTNVEIEKALWYSALSLSEDIVTVEAINCLKTSRGTK